MPAPMPRPRQPPAAARRSLVTLGLLRGVRGRRVRGALAARLLRHRRRPPRGSEGPFRQLFDFDAETMQNALGSLSQVIAAVLGIAITVVSIVVQLAATRYTSRVADLFFRDRINLGVMGFFVVACVEALWVSLTVRTDYVPQATITATVIMASGSLLLLVPYFAYVFDFLDPEKVIARIGVADARARDRRASGRGRRRADAVDRAPGAGGQRPRAPGRHRGQRARAEGQGDRHRRLGGAAPPAGRVPGAQGDARRRVVRDRRGAARRSRLRRAGRRLARRPRAAGAPGSSGRGCARSARCSARR